MEAIAFMGRTYKRFHRCGEVHFWWGSALLTPAVILMQIRIMTPSRKPPET